MQPAHKTKHLTTLEYPFSTSSTRYTFHLSQTQSLTSHVSGLNSESALSTTNSTNGTTGTTLWLGAQCLAVYLAQHHKPLSAKSNAEPLQAIELGSGIGLCSLVLSALGYSTVYSTDTRLVIDSVLRRNIEANKPEIFDIDRNQQILIRELDWHVPPGNWNWNDENAIACFSSTKSETAKQTMSKFNLIITSDTVYDESLVQPLLRTLHALSAQSLSVSGVESVSSLSPSSSSRSSAPLVFLALERRDPAFIDSFLASAYQWGFDTQQIPKRKLSKVLQKYAENWNRDRGEWDGVEIWKLVLKSNRIAENTLSTAVGI